MNKVSKFFLLLIFTFIVALVILMKYLAPYGEAYMPVWIEKGNILVKAVKNYKNEHRIYPVKLPLDPNCEDIPGCRKVSYVSDIDRDGKEYFRITISIHLREALIYDSRKNLSQSDSWGSYKIQNDWMWTKD